MGWDAHVYLAKKKIAKALVAKTYAEMRTRYGAPVHADADPDEFSFDGFQVHLERDPKAGIYFYVTSDEIGPHAHDSENAGLCMREWAELLGGAISEEEWSERIASAQNAKLAPLKLPKYGAADTFCYLAFDEAGIERGRKSVSKEMHETLKVQLLEPAWLREHSVTRVERLSFNCEGVVGDRVSFAVGRTGERRRVEED